MEGKIRLCHDLMCDLFCAGLMGTIVTSYQLPVHALSARFRNQICNFHMLQNFTTVLRFSLSEIRREKRNERNRVDN
jgi:hypothetical protein